MKKTFLYACPVCGQWKRPPMSDDPPPMCPDCGRPMARRTAPLEGQVCAARQAAPPAARAARGAGPERPAASNLGTGRGEAGTAAQTAEGERPNDTGRGVRPERTAASNLGTRPSALGAPLRADQVIARLRTGVAISGDSPVSSLARGITGLNEFLSLFGLESAMWADNGRFSIQIFETE